MTFAKDIKVGDYVVFADGVIRQVFLAGDDVHGEVVFVGQTRDGDVATFHGGPFCKFEVVDEWEVILLGLGVPA